MAIPVTCLCGKALQVKDELAGKRGKCPQCGAALIVPKTRPGERTAVPKRAGQNQSSPESGIAPVQLKGKLASESAESCPSCAAALPFNAVLCVNCGFDLRAGARMTTSIGRRARPEGKGNRGVLIVASAGVGMVIVASALVYLFFLRGSSTPEASTRGTSKTEDLKAKDHLVWNGSKWIPKSKTGKEGIGKAEKAPHAIANEEAEREAEAARLKVAQEEEASRQAAIAQIEAEKQKETLRAAEAARLKAAGPRIVLGVSGQDPVVFSEFTSGMAAHFADVKYDQFGRIESYVVHVVDGPRERIVKVRPKAPPQFGKVAEYVADLNGIQIPALSKADKGVIGFSLKEPGGVVLAYIGTIEVNRTDKFAYDTFGRRQMESQTFVYDGKSYEITYTDYARDRNGRMSSYKVHIKKAG